MTRLLFSAAIVLFALSAQGEERAQRWEAGFSGGYTVMGGNRQTGGFTLAGHARSVWILNGIEYTAGGGVTAIGIENAAHWIGILGGPVAGAQVRFSGSFAAGASLAIDLGRIPICNAWGLCLRYVGFFPAVTPSISWYAEKRVAAKASFGLRYVSTLGWSGAAMEPSISGVFWW